MLQNLTGGVHLRLKQRITNHVRRYFYLYLILIGIYLSGIVFGVFGVNALQSGEKEELSSFVQQLLGQIGSIAPADAGKQLLWDNVATVVIFCLLGMTIIGMPIVFLITFTKGFTVGFAVSFLVQEKAWQGLWLSLAALFPSFLVAMPIQIITAVLAIGFSLRLARGFNDRYPGGVTRELGVYSGTCVLMALFAGLAAVVQGYIGIVLLKLASA